MKISCDVILDLIPLVKDSVSSEESRILVEGHLKRCSSCKSEFETIGTSRVEQLNIKDQMIIQSIKRRVLLTQLIVLIIGAIIGVALSNTMNMFYNLLIMPIIGGVAFIRFQTKWYFAPIGIFTLAYLWETISIFLVDGFSWRAFAAGFYFSIIYTVLVFLGVIITVLLKIALRKGE